MKAIIEGKRYNTETSKRLGYWDNGLDDSDFNSVDESLYITKNGNYFLYCTGGARTEYAQRWNNGNSSCSGRRIIPMTAEEAFKWAESRQVVDTIEEHFPKMIQDA
jgi:hypothetical protein